MSDTDQSGQTPAAGNVRIPVDELQKQISDMRQPLPEWASLPHERMTDLEIRDLLNGRH